MDSSKEMNELEILELIKQLQGSTKKAKRSSAKRAIKMVTRIIDSVIGIVIGGVGGAIIGGSTGVAQGAMAGAVSIANDPYTLHYDYAKQRGYTIVGPDMHSQEQENSETNIDINEEESNE